jgi:hypothetical protein
MKNYLMIGAASPQSLASTVRLWNASRDPVRYGLEVGIEWDAAAGEFAADNLPDSLDGPFYCPGSIRLQPFHRLTDESAWVSGQVVAVAGSPGVLRRFC